MMTILRFVNGNPAKKKKKKKERKKKKKIGEKATLIK